MSFHTLVRDVVNFHTFHRIHPILFLMGWRVGAVPNVQIRFGGSRTLSISIPAYHLEVSANESGTATWQHYILRGGFWPLGFGFWVLGYEFWVLGVLGSATVHISALAAMTGASRFSEEVASWRYDVVSSWLLPSVIFSLSMV